MVPGMDLYQDVWQNNQFLKRLTIYPLSNITYKLNIKNVLNLKFRINTIICFQMNRKKSFSEVIINNLFHIKTIDTEFMFIPSKMTQNSRFPWIHKVIR